jgi:hypothetical protein
MDQVVYDWYCCFFYSIENVIILDHKHNHCASINIVNGPDELNSKEKR